MQESETGARPGSTSGASSRLGGVSSTAGSMRSLVSQRVGEMGEPTSPVPSLRILHVSRRFTGDGGIQKYVQEIQRVQVEQGHRSDVLCTGYHRGLGVRRTRLAGGTLYELPELVTIASSGTVSVRVDWFRRLVGRYDIVHFHYPNPLGDLYGALLGGRTCVPKVATFHGEVADSKPLSSLYRSMTARFLRQMDRIIVTSPNMRDTSGLLAPMTEKCRVVPLGIDPLAPPTSQSVAGLAPDWMEPRILFVGRLSRYKGVEVLLQAMTKASGYLMLVGRGELEHQLKAQARALGIDGRTTFCGFVEDAELGAYFQLADILVLPSVDRGEGFGYVLLEAMSSATAMVTTDLGTGTSFANVHGVTGAVVPPNDWEALAQAIDELVSEGEYLNRYKRSAVRRYEELFSLRTMEAGVMEVYRECLA